MVSANEKLSHVCPTKGGLRVCSPTYACSKVCLVLKDVSPPMGEELKWLLKEGGGLILECFDISL